MSSRLRRNLNYCTLDGIFSVPTAFLVTPGNIVITILLARYYSLSTFQLGVLFALPSACNTLQIAVMPFLHQRFTPKRLNFFGSTVHSATYIVLALLLFWLPPDGSTAVFITLAVLLLTQSLMLSLLVIAWSSWVQEFTPERIRGKYFGMRNTVIQAMTAAYLILVGLWLEHSRQGGTIALRNGLISLLLISMTLRFASIQVQRRIFSSVDLHVEKAGGAEPVMSWLQQLQLIISNRNILWYFAFGAAFGFTSNLVGPFLNVFMLDVLDMSAWQITTLVLLSSVAGAIAMKGWGKMIDRFGNRPVMAFCLVIWMSNGWVWVVANPERLWVLYFGWTMGGIFGAGFVQGLFGLLLKIIPPDAKIVAISINTAVTSLPGAIAPILAGALMEFSINHGFQKLTVYQNAAGIHHILVLLTVFIILRVQEPKSQPVGELIGAMRSYRQVASIFGLSFLSDYLFFLKRKIRA